MPSSSNPRALLLLVATILLSALLPFTSAHFEVVYPGWRGNTLRDDLQWTYPCGGLPQTTNRTRWPITSSTSSGGRALSIIPGWNAGHPTSFFYVNMGFGTTPVNMTNVMLPVFQTTGPSRDPFRGQFCLPDVPLPAGANVRVGDNATVQVIQVALHGASLYNCADITFVEPQDADPIPEGMCTNSSTIGFNLVYTTKSSASASYSIGAMAERRRSWSVLVAGLVGVVGVVVGGVVVG